MVGQTKIHYRDTHLGHADTESLKRATLSAKPSENCQINLLPHPESSMTIPSWDKPEFLYPRLAIASGNKKNQTQGNHLRNQKSLLQASLSLFFPGTQQSRTTQMKAKGGKAHLQISSLCPLFAGKEMAPKHQPQKSSISGQDCLSNPVPSQRGCQVHANSPPALCAGARQPSSVPCLFYCWGVAAKA